MDLYVFDMSMMKSMEIKNHRDAGIGNGRRKP
jgi:hypothetical protein